MSDRPNGGRSVARQPRTDKPVPMRRRAGPPVRRDARGGENKPPRRHPRNLILKIAAVVMILGLVAGGAGIGLLAAWMSDTPALDMTKFMYSAPSRVYDANGRLYQEIQSVERRIPVTLSDTTEMVMEAFLSVEDQRFYSHEGIDVRGTVKAVFSVLRRGSTDGPGGSTITQQVIKQTHLSSEKELVRKVQEWKLAYTLEQRMSKREIMQVYLNECNMSITWGIGSAAQLFFNKEVKDLTIAQAAVLAAIVNLPGRYNPYVYETDDQGRRILSVEKSSDGKSDRYKYSEYNQQRAQEILRKMLELGYISQREHDIASRDLRENLISLTNPSLDNSSYSYYTDAVIYAVADELVARGDYASTSEVLRALSLGGFDIYSYVDTDIQAALEHQATVNSNFPAQSTQAKNATDAMNKLNADDPSYTPVNYLPEVGMTVVENATGNVVGILGGRGVKSGMLTENRALQKKQIGSTTKPITVYAPGFDSKILTLATTFDNVKMKFPGGFTPVNYPATYTGMTSCRTGIRDSINIVAVFGFYRVGLETSQSYGAKFGFIFDDRDIGPGAMALGGYTYGQTSLQLASAYSTFANGGWRITPAFFSKVTKSGMEDLYPTRSRSEVLSPEASWLATSAMKEVVNGGMADLTVSGQEIAGKTGTTGEKFATLFGGFTARYSGGVWYGYDYMKKTVNGKTYSLRIGDTNGRSGRGPSPAVFWQNVFQEFYKKKGLPSERLPAMPDAVHSYPIDKVSGKRPTELTDLDPRGPMTGTEYFWDGTYPMEDDDMHTLVPVCAYTGLLPLSTCPTTLSVFILKDPLRLYPAGCTPVGKENPDTAYLVPTEICSGYHRSPFFPYPGGGEENP